MDRRIRYHPLFDCDVREAANWYDRRSTGLGDTFVQNAKTATETIISHPSRFSATASGLRYVRIAKFPYIVLFHVDDEELFLIGVLHTARSIDKWKETRGR